MLNGHSKRDKTNILITFGNLLQVESIADCEHSAMLLTCMLSDNWSRTPFFGLFESGRFTQVFRDECSDGTGYPVKWKIPMLSGYQDRP